MGVLFDMKALAKWIRTQNKDWKMKSGNREAGRSVESRKRMGVKGGRDLFFLAITVEEKKETENTQKST